jgi:hypothetical protein
MEANIGYGSSPVIPEPMHAEGSDDWMGKGGIVNEIKLKNN